MNTYKEDGMIVKPFYYYSTTIYGKDSRGTAAIIIDQCNRTVDIDLTAGAMPFARDVILFLLSDKDVRLLIRKYQQGKRHELFSIRVSAGFSGRHDIYINYYNKHGLQTGGKKLLHVSQYGKLNEGWRKMYIGDFVEMIASLMEQSNSDYDLSNPKRLLSLSGCQYIKGYFCDSAACDVSKIF